MTVARRRVLLVCPSGTAGTLQYTHNLANALATQGCQVTLATAIGYEMAPFSRKYDAIEVFDRFKLHREPVKAFLSAVRALDPDIVHFQGAQKPEFYWLMMKLLRRITRAQFVWTPQDVFSNSKTPWHPRLLRHLYGRMGHVWMNAQQNADTVADIFAVPQEKITVLPMPDLTAFARDGLDSKLPPEMTLLPDSPMILCFGIIEERKGIRTLAEAFAQLRTAGTDATLMIIGKAIMDPGSITEILDKSGIGPDWAQVIPRYASFEELNALFQRAHHLVLPYHTGWNSGVLASAYGYGRPVITSTVGGFEEVVFPGKTGLLVPPKDPDALANAMTQLLTNPDLAARLAAGAAETGRAASWESVAATTIGDYDKALARQ